MASASVLSPAQRPEEQAVRDAEGRGAEADPERKGEAGKELIRAIFGKDAIAEDPIF